MILASCSYEEAKKFNNKLVVVSEKEVKKPEEVLLNIQTEEPESIFNRGIGVAKCITTKVSPSYCPNNLKGNVFRVYKYLEDYGEIDFAGDSSKVKEENDFSNMSKEPEGVIPLVLLPDGFSDMRFVYELSMKYPNARMYGGNLLEIPGIKIGRYDKGKEKMSSVFNGIYDIFKEVPLDSITVKEVMSKVRSKASNGIRPKKSVVKKPNLKAKKLETFSKFFGDSGSEF